jgi:hypothetical protein
MRAAPENVVGHCFVRYVFGAAVLFAGACGGSSKPAEKPISNTDTASTPESSGPKGPGEGRVIQRTQTGGVIELSGDRRGAMKQADEEMAAHCGPNNYTIVQEGEEAVGADTYSPSGSAPSNNGSVTTRTETAWRLHYQCNGN